MPTLTEKKKGKKPDFDFVEVGLYAKQLKNWLKGFPKEQLLVILSEDFFAHTQESMDKIYQFLELPPHIHESFPIANSSNKSLKMEPKTREFLAEFYRPYNKELQELFVELGLDLIVNWQ